MENRKFKALMDTAERLFMKHGFRRVTIKELCEKADVSKMTFYKHFDNKADLVKFMIDVLISRNMERYRSIMNSDMPYAAKIRKIIDLKMEQTRNVSREFFEDIHIYSEPDIRDHMRERTDSTVQEMLADFTEAQRQGYIRADIKPEFILYFLNHMFEMVKDARLSGIYESPSELIMELVNFFFYGIMGESGIEEGRDEK